MTPRNEAKQMAPAAVYRTHGGTRTAPGGRKRIVRKGSLGVVSVNGAQFICMGNTTPVRS